MDDNIDQRQWAKYIMASLDVRAETALKNNNKKRPAQ